MSTPATPLHPRGVATLHDGVGSTIDALRTSLEDLRDRTWTGERAWATTRSGIAARRGRDALALVPMVANHGLTRVEMTWRTGRRVKARLTMPCDASTFPAAPVRNADPDRYLGVVQPIVDAEAILDCVRALTDAALDLLHPESLYDIQHEWSLHTPLMRAVDRHVSLAGAAAVAASRAGEGHGLASRTHLASPWRGATLMQFDGIETAGIQEPLQRMLDADASGLPRFCEIASNTPYDPDRDPAMGFRLFEVVIRPVSCDLEAPDTLEAMRRVSEAAA
jgi:hypothetical protein